MGETLSLTVPSWQSLGTTLHCLSYNRDQQKWRRSFQKHLLERAPALGSWPISLSLASQACYSWNPARHFLKKNPCHFKVLVPCLGHISMFLAAVAMLPAVQICPIRHSPMGWNSVWNLPATDQEWIGVKAPPLLGKAHREPSTGLPQDGSPLWQCPAPWGWGSPFPPQWHPRTEQGRLGRGKAAGAGVGWGRGWEEAPTDTKGTARSPLSSLFKQHRDRDSLPPGTRLSYSLGPEL